ncbi:MAG: hypothetical protein ACTSPQ_04915 [Candidatus Helarchaeota archaeon]
MEIREINIKTNIREQIVDITHEVEELIKELWRLRAYRRKFSSSCQSNFNRFFSNYLNRK